jgi:hypothetical protein
VSERSKRTDQRNERLIRSQIELSRLLCPVQPFVKRMTL